VAILGIESLVYGVDDIDRCSRFWNDFGLLEIERKPDRSVFETVSGSRVIVLDRADCGVPEWFEGNGGKLVVWGVDTADNLERLADGLAHDRKVRRDVDGSAYSATDEGIPFGLRVWNKRPVVSAPDPVNAPGNIQRLNLHRKWRKRAIPKTLSHVVLSTADYAGTYEFYRHRLGFRLSDHSRGLGVFMRADGAHEHHSIFWLNANGPFVKSKPCFQHSAFGVEDIDEVMIGVNRMGERGWFKDLRKTGGLGRHRISSAIYCYVPNPNGGEAEYTCDTDYLDDNWIPRVWQWQFGAVMWAHDRPAVYGSMDDNWDVRLDPGGHTIEEYRVPGSDGVKQAAVK
jgi:catechol 2,3-dioxygenase-like lactoylglutathione lyase family enzyme